MSEFGKAGSGGVAYSSVTDRSRRDRVRALTLATIDLKNDEYLFRNHLGQYECKLCHTIHKTEANYLSHTQAKKHQEGLQFKKAREQRAWAVMPQPKKVSVKRKTAKIGQPTFKVTKHRDTLDQQALRFELHFPEIADGYQPRHRFMSAFEQRVDKPDRAFQYLLFAAEPYETIGFKIPNRRVDRSPERFFTNWDWDSQTFSLTLSFLDESPDADAGQTGAVGVAGPAAIDLD
eukprot:c7586_g1_i1.p1 GENE.c7586_g1_i1~~c7586_g1_i1.p1  ORF type:complete len:243 (-),score=45.45 c7586_g1_i1:259-957(-)